jgi:signal transduction histidine kinase
LEFVVHFLLHIAVVYSHFYYLIIVVAGLWYGRKAILIALFFGALHIAGTYLTVGVITPDALIRACMFIIVAFVIGHIAEQINCYRDQLLKQNHELIELNVQLEYSQKAFETANKKLNLLSSITRHDIKNQLVALIGFIELSKENVSESELKHFIAVEETASQNILRQIEFTKNYEEIGIHAPQWQDIGMRLHALQSLMPPGDIEMSVSIEGLEIFADPLLEKVFENLIDNSRRHGVRVRHVSFSSLQYGKGDLAIVYEDDGAGVRDTDKERIFEKGFGKNTGLGLFLSREILSITGLSMKESGFYGKGVRFEILVPKGKFRFVKPATN